eukprot:SAG31_NODE_761_length_12276_cov_4.530673_2_plen_61_part_00
MSLRGPVLAGRIERADAVACGPPHHVHAHDALLLSLRCVCTRSGPIELAYSAEEGHTVTY